MSFPSQFIYKKLTSLEQLQNIMVSLNTDIEYLAGGTDLLVDLKQGKIHPQMIIDLKGIPSLKGVRKLDNGNILIGALTLINDLATNDLLISQALALAEGAQNLGSWQIRNRATIGGNLASALPTADTAAVLLALNAQIHTWGLKGERVISTKNFWLGPGKSALIPGEIICAIELPMIGAMSAYIKHGLRQAMDIAILNVAVVLKIEDNKFREVSIALGGVAPTPIRLNHAEEYLMGKEVDKIELIEAGRLAADASNPRSSIRASREYRLAVIPVLVERALQTAIDRCKLVSVNKEE